MSFPCTGDSGRAKPNPSSSGPSGSPHIPAVRLDIHSLVPIVQKLFAAGVAPSTKRARLTPGRTRNRLPITPRILRQLKAVWKKETNRRNAKMLWAAACLCFFGFLRSGEAVAPTESNYDPFYHLCFKDISIDNTKLPTSMKVTIKASKTDPFRHGVTLHLGRTGTDLCPVSAVLEYMVARGCEAGPLFIWQDGKYLTRANFVKGVRAAAGLNTRDYAGHSFRIGAATTASTRGIQDSLIKTLGRWESSALYPNSPRGLASSFSDVGVSVMGVEWTMRE